MHRKEHPKEHPKKKIIKKNKTQNTESTPETPTQKPIDINEIKDYVVLHQVPDSTVYKAQAGEVTVAIKETTGEKTKKKENMAMIWSLHREIAVLEKFKMCNVLGPNIEGAQYVIKILLSVNTSQTTDFGINYKSKMVLEHGNGGNLSKWVAENKDRELDEPLETLIYQFTQQLIQGVAYIHHHKIVHCDLKKDNCVFFIDNDNRYTLKIIDFGLSIDLETEPNHEYCHGTDLYKAPEVLHKKKNTLVSDVYSLSTTLWEIWVRKTIYSDVRGPFQDVDDLHEFVVMKQGRSYMPIDMPAKIAHLITGGFLEPVKRLKASEMKKEVATGLDEVSERLSEIKVRAKPS